MIYKIQRYEHHSSPVRLGFWWGRDRFRWAVTFSESCRYDLKTADQLDVNKLCGIGYLPGHHKESARFGWRYNKEMDKIELFAYCYVNGERITRFLEWIRIGEKRIISLDVNYASYVFNSGERMLSISFSHRKKFQYFLRPYFGGNIPALNDLTIELKPI